MAKPQKIDKARGERIRYVRTERLGHSQEKFAEVVSASLGEPLSRGAVGNWELGKPIALKSLRAIARSGRVPLEWLTDNIGSPDDEPHSHSDQLMVPVVGYVGAGAAAHYYAVTQGELDRVQAPDGSQKNTVAVEVRGDSIGPLFNHWLVYYDDVRAPVTADLIGRLCVVGLPDDRILVKLVRKSRRFSGLYDLISNSHEEPPIEGVEIAWAARVKHMTPR